MKPMITKTILERLQKNMKPCCLQKTWSACPQHNRAQCGNCLYSRKCNFKGMARRPQQGSITLEKAPLQWIDRVLFLNSSHLLRIFTLLLRTHNLKRFLPQLK